MKMFRSIPILILAICVAQITQSFAQQKVKDLKFHYMQDYAWMRLAQIVPSVTDRVILPVGTVEVHGVCPIGTDNVVPLKMAELIWEKCNALVAPVINHGVTSADISQFPGSITIRPEIFEEYVYDVLKDLVRTGFRNILILNGHGDNAEPIKKAMARINRETGAHFMNVDWWLVAANVVSEVYGVKAPMGDHAALEESAIVMSVNPDLIDKEMYDKLGKENIARANTDAGVAMMPAWTTMFPPAAGVGFLDFDTAKAKTYTQKKADFIANTFLEAVNRWEMMESWKKGIK